MSARPEEPTKSVTGRALTVLAAFDVQHPRLTLTELSRRTGLPLATVHRLARELEQWRALDRDDQGRYGVGFRLWEMGLLAPVHSRLREVAMPYLLDVHRASGETVQLAACDGFEAVYVDKLTSSDAVPAASRIGARLPLHATGIGKALLAFQPDAYIDALLQRPLERATTFTKSDPSSLRKDLNLIRSRGYATSSQEYVLGATSLAVPVLIDDRAIAALGIISYDMRDDLEQFADVCIEAATRIAARLQSAPDDPFPTLINDLGV